MRDALKLRTALLNRFGLDPIDTLLRAMRGQGLFRTQRPLHRSPAPVSVAQCLAAPFARHAGATRLAAVSSLDWVNVTAG